MQSKNVPTLFLTSPWYAHAYCLHIYYNPEDGKTRNKIMSRARAIDEKHNAHIFFQCDSCESGYMMLEFWTHDNDAILEFCNDFAELLGAEVELCDIRDVPRNYDAIRVMTA